MLGNLYNEKNTSEGSQYCFPILQIGGGMTWKYNKSEKKQFGGDISFNVLWGSLVNIKPGANCDRYFNLAELEEGEYRVKVTKTPS